MDVGRHRAELNEVGSGDRETARRVRSFGRSRRKLENQGGPDKVQIRLVVGFAPRDHRANGMRTLAAHRVADSSAMTSPSWRC